MSVKESFVRCVLVLSVVITFLGFSSTSAYAFPPTGLPNGQGNSCNPRPCGPQRLSSGEPAIINPLTVDFDFANPNQFVTDIEGASSDPRDIVQLVDDAVTVWRAAFKDLPDINLGVGWANFGVLEKIDKDFLSGVLVGGVQRDCNEEDPDDNLGIPAPTELPAISGDIIGIHICGKRVDDLMPGSVSLEDQPPCTKSEAKEATILFNSELLRIQEEGKEANNIKLFLDTKPFESSAFGPIETIGNPAHRLKRSFEFSDPYVVDLFTVALHEVGHALGYAEGFGVTPGHVGELGIPHVLSPYVPFSTRKCPSKADVKGLISVGPPVDIDNSTGYELVSDDPCDTVSNDAIQPFNWLKLLILLPIALLIGLTTFLFWRKRSQNLKEETATEE